MATAVLERVETYKSAYTSAQEFVFAREGHFHQPFRKTRILSDSNPNARINIEPGPEHLKGFPDINERIFHENYNPMLVGVDYGDPRASRPFPPGSLSSLSYSLLSWIKYAHPQEFRTIVKNVNDQEDNKRYVVEANPGFHTILPTKPDKVKAMLIDLGFEGFRRDFGFYPAGLFLPEKAIDTNTVNVIGRLKERYGIEYITLMAYQVAKNSNGPVYCEFTDIDGKLERLPIILFDGDISGSFSFNDRPTQNADVFFEEAKEERATKRREQGQSLQIPELVMIASDGELYGHHKEFRDRFAEYSMRTSTLMAHGFEAFNVRKALSSTYLEKTEIKSPSSWSCYHGVQRWTGECDEGVADEQDKLDKKQLYWRTKGIEEKIYSALDDPENGIKDWSPKLVAVILETTPEMFFEGDIYDKLDMLSNEPGLNFLKNRRKRDLLLAAYSLEAGDQSDKMFFARGIERAIGWRLVTEAEILYNRSC